MSRAVLKFFNDIHIVGETKCRACYFPPTKCKRINCNGILHSSQEFDITEDGCERFFIYACDVCGSDDDWSLDTASEEEISKSYERLGSASFEQLQSERAKKDPLPNEVALTWSREAQRVLSPCPHPTSPQPSTPESNSLKSVRPPDAAGDLHRVLMSGYFSDVIGSFSHLWDKKMSHRGVRAGAMAYFYQLATSGQDYFETFTERDEDTGQTYEFRMARHDDSPKACARIAVCRNMVGFWTQEWPIHKYEANEVSMNWELEAAILVGDRKEVHDLLQIQAIKGWRTEVEVDALRTHYEFERIFTSEASKFFIDSFSQLRDRPAIEKIERAYSLRFDAAQLERNRTWDGLGVRLTAAAMTRGHFALSYDDSALVKGIAYRSRKKFRELGPVSTAYRAMIAILLDGAGSADAAIEEYSDLCLLDFGVAEFDPTPLFALRAAELLSSTNVAAAKNLLAKFVEKRPDKAVVLQLARLSIKSNDVVGAEHLLSYPAVQEERDLFLALVGASELKKRQIAEDRAKSWPHFKWLEMDSREDLIEAEHSLLGAAAKQKDAIFRFATMAERELREKIFASYATKYGARHRSRDEYLAAFCNSERKAPLTLSQMIGCIRKAKEDGAHCERDLRVLISEKCPNVFRPEWERAANYLRAFRNPTMHGDILAHLTASEMEKNIQLFLSPLLAMAER